MSIQFLPKEVLERIFECLDGRSFAICSEVCPLWRIVSLNMLKVRDWWKDFCISEIPRSMLQDLCGKISMETISSTDISLTNQPNRNTRINWYKIYRKWFLCNMVSSKQYQIKTFSCLDSTPITCCKLSGTWILTAHRNGSLCAWSSENGEMIRIVTQHLRMITDFILLDLLNFGIYNCTFYESPCGHQFTVSVSKDHNIQISSLLEDTYGLYFGSQVIRQHSDSLESIKLFGDRFAVLCANNTVSVWQLVSKENPLDLPTALLQYVLTGPEEMIAWISFWDNKLGCLCKTGVFKEFDLSSENWSDDQHPELQVIRNSKQDKDDVFPDNYTLIMNTATLFWNSMIFLVSADNHLWVSVSGSKYTMYPIMQEFHSYVMCVSLCGTILALGLENGILLIFVVTMPEDFMEVHKVRPVLQKKLSPASIIAVDILAREEGPIIFAATTNSMMVIRWPEVYKQ